MRKTTKDEEIKLLTDRCFSYQDRIKALEKISQDRQSALIHNLNITQQELKGVYKQLALIYLADRKPQKEISE